MHIQAEKATRNSDKGKPENNHVTLSFSRIQRERIRSTSSHVHLRWAHMRYFRHVYAVFCYLAFLLTYSTLPNGAISHIRRTTKYDQILTLTISLRIEGQVTEVSLSSRQFIVISVPVRTIKLAFKYFFPVVVVVISINRSSVMEEFGEGGKML